MIRIEQLAHVGIRVREFTRAVEFYQTLGFRVTRQDYQERVVVLQHPGGLVLNLLDSVNHENDGRNVLMDEENVYPGYTHIAMQVKDVQRARHEVESSGFTLTEGPVSFGDGSTSIFFRDPDRNVIELSEPATMITEQQEH